MTIDLDRVRRDTPGCAGLVHFNNAGAALPARVVLDAVVGHLELEARMGGYEAAEQNSGSVERCYDSVARLLSCGREEIALIENATRAWDMAFYALPFGPGDRILTATAEYASNYLPFLQVARRTGAIVEPVPNDETGQLDVAALERMMDERVKLIAVTHVPTNGGLVNPAAEIGRVAKAAGVPFLLDACQSAGQMPLDVQGLGCDILSATGRKYLRGPRGTGFLYIRQDFLETLEPPFIDLHAAEWVAPDRYVLRHDARRFETWESFVAGRIGLGVAVDYALDLGLEAIRDRITILARAVREGLAAIRGVTVRDLGRERCGIVSFTVDGQNPEEIKRSLAADGINISCSSAAGTRLDMDTRGLASVARASVHYYNSEVEVERFLGAIEALAGN